MNKYITPIAVAILLVTATTFTRAQNALVNSPAPTSKFGDIVEVSFSTIGNEEGVLSMGLRNVFLLKRTDDFSFGLGAGLESYGDGGGSGTLALPLSADLRWYFNKSNKAAYPFLNLNGGYSINFNREQFRTNNNNVFLGCNFGVNFVATTNLSLQLALGLKLDHFGPILSDYGLNSANYLSVPVTIGVAF